MTEAELISTYPRVWHMAEDGSWPSIRQNGLLSTSALLDLYEIKGELRTNILSNNRRESVTLSRKGLADAVVRDQKPMSDGALQKCLHPGISPRQWYEFLNERVFFWMTSQRLRDLLKARAYRDRPHTILVVRTKTLVAVHRDRIRLSPINSGATIYNPSPRGYGTFCSIEEFPFDEWRRRRGSRKKAIAELTVTGGVPDIMEHLLAVHRVTTDGSKELWRSPKAGRDGEL